MIRARALMLAFAAALPLATAFGASAAPIARDVADSGLHRGQTRLTSPDSGADLFFDQRANVIAFAPHGAPDRGAALGELLAAFFAQAARAERYGFSGPSADGLAARLADALLADPGWNPKRGAAREGSDAATLLRALNTHPPFADLAQAWKTQGYTLKAASVENILIGRRAELPGGADRRDGDARVPTSLVIRYVATKGD